MFVSARHIFVAQDRRQTAECPDTDGDKRILKRQGLIETQRHGFFQELALCLPANVGADASESGSRHDRIWEEVRSRLGRDTTASGTVFANKYRIWFIGVVAPCFTRCCHVACAMWWIYIEVALAFGTEIHPLKTSKASMIFYCV